MKLAAFSDRYTSLKVTHQDGDPFQEIHREPTTSLDTLLIAVYLMPRVPLSAQVQHHGNIIGRMEAVWIPETIYMHAYMFFALVMVFVIMQLYMRLLKSKTRLEERVNHRTAELMASNLELKQEIEERARAEEALRTSEQKTSSAVGEYKRHYLDHGSESELHLYQPGGHQGPGLASG